MSNILLFEDAKRRKMEREEVRKKQIEQESNKIGGLKFAPSTSDVSFYTEAKAFKFIRMIPPGAFVQIDASKMPPFFPPDPPPPMAA